jgi:hypothetical protein
MPSAEVDGLFSGRTYYFGVFATKDGQYSDNASYVAATTYAGYTDPTTPAPADWDTNDVVLENSIAGGLIDFISSYGELPHGKVGLLGYVSIFLFGLVALACYNKSVGLTLAFAVVGLLLGNTLGVFSTILLIIAVILGITVSHLRGGQPSGG